MAVAIPHPTAPDITAVVAIRATAISGVIGTVSVRVRPIPVISTVIRSCGGTEQQSGSKADTEAPPAPAPATSAPAAMPPTTVPPTTVPATTPASAGCVWTHDRRSCNGDHHHRRKSDTSQFVAHGTLP